MVSAHTVFMWIEIVQVILTAVLSLILLFVLTKLMGNKQISQLSMFDYVIGITIGSITAEMATELENPLYPAIAVAVYAIVAFGISVLTNKSLAARKVVTGVPLILMDAGVIYRESLKKARFDIGDYLALCRIAGFFDLSEIQTAILEENGTVSFLPKSELRPVHPADIGVFPAHSALTPNVIVDGILLRDNLVQAGHDEPWLRSELQSLGYNAYKQVFLACISKDDKLNVYPITRKKPTQPFA